MSSCRVDKPSEIVDVGDKVWVKLIGREVKFSVTSCGLKDYKKLVLLEFCDGEHVNVHSG